MKKLYYPGKSIEETTNNIREKDVKNTMEYVLSKIRGNAIYLRKKLFG